MTIRKIMQNFSNINFLNFFVMEISICSIFFWSSLPFCPVIYLFSKEVPNSVLIDCVHELF
jgi:hypothetical protein